MSLFKAGIKFIARTMNDKYRDSKIQKNKKLAFKDTRNDFKKANSKGHYISGKKHYQKHLYQRNKTADDFHSNIDKLISDI